MRNGQRGERELFGDLRAQQLQLGLDERCDFLQRIAREVDNAFVLGARGPPPDFHFTGR